MFILMVEAGIAEDMGMGTATCQRDRKR